MPDQGPAALRLFVDSSVLCAGALSNTGASYALLSVAGVGLVDARCSPFVRDEVLGSAARKLPGILPALKLLLAETVKEGAGAPLELCDACKPYADPQDHVVLADAIHQGCSHLVTLNEKDFWPPSDRITVLRPGPLLQQLRASLLTLGR